MSSRELLRLGLAVLGAGGSLSTAKAAILLENTEINVVEIKCTIFVSLAKIEASS